MTGYQKILNSMRRQAVKTAEDGVRLGTIGENDTCIVGDLVLDKEDYMIAEHLIIGYTDKDGNSMPGIEEGDTVVVKRISDELYVIIERVV